MTGEGQRKNIPRPIAGWRRGSAAGPLPVGRGFESPSRNNQRTRPPAGGTKKELTMKDIAQDIADTIMERPIGFDVDGRHFSLYPPTLGMLYMMQRLTAKMGLKPKAMAVNPFAECLRLAGRKREECLALVACATLRGREQLTDTAAVRKRTEELERLSKEELAKTLLLVLTSERSAERMERLGIRRDRERMRQVLRAKKDSDSYSFGCVSIYGSLLDAACERYGWTLDYVVWGISYENLRLMLADKPDTVYLTKEERRRCHVPNKAAADGNNADQMREMMRQITGR